MANCAVFAGEAPSTLPALIRGALSLQLQCCKRAAAAAADSSDTQVKAQIEEKEGKTFDVFTAVEFKTQLVAGTNYFIKVHVGNEEFMHLRVFKSLPHENEQLSLHSYQGSKTKHDELAYF
uniref:Cystatin B n=1 Tax=Serinus canaria TaxID=9135 RepID=A0A8C9UEF2_SERCA